MTGAHAIDRKRSGSASCAMRRRKFVANCGVRLAGHERVDTAIHELLHCTRVPERFPARIAFHCVREQLGLVFGAKLAERCVG